MSDVRSCGQCGVILPADSPHGVCPSCFMRVGLAADATGTQSHQPDRQPFTPPKPAELSVHFPQLEILELIGQGGMGAVYRARQVGLDRIVALKILPPHARDDGTFASRFEREARSLARLNHPNIIAVFDSGRAADFYYFVMEYVDGVNLREAIGAGTLAPAEALAIVPQICDALQYAHDEGIVHRDIKPENVLIDKKGNTKIADFGLARLLGPTTDLTLTGTHQVMGTPRYMAPEQMEGSHEVDHRADIYSLGVVFYEMLTGELPMGRFDGPSKKVQVDVRLDEVVFRTLEKEPDRRYQHASDVKNDVQTICGGGRAVAAPRATSYEYKSKTHLFGWPLVHVAFGTDPETGKILSARGIIAVGNIAYGVIAIGSFAIGGVAFGGGAVGGLAFGGGAVGSLAIGGAAMGLFSFGGLAIGLLLATGGVALGLGLSYGGVAVGAVAKGGVAVGWYAQGALAFGIHASGTNVHDGPADRLFENFGELGVRTGMIGIIFVAAVTILVGTLVSIRLLAKKKERPPVNLPPKMAPSHLDPTTRRSNSGIVIAVVLIGCFVVLCVVPILGLGLSYTTLRSVPRTDQAALPSIDRITPAAAEIFGGIVWAEDGPSLNPNLLSTGGALTSEQLASMNQILSDAHNAYLELEEKTIEQNEAGHWVTTVNVTDESKLVDLENQVWTKVDAVVDVSWQNLLRSSLGLYGSGDVGVLGFNGRQGKIEIWKVGSWYHWIVTPSMNRRGYDPPHSAHEGENSAPQLPHRYQRFWNEPAADAAGTSP